MFLQRCSSVFPAKAGTQRWVPDPEWIPVKTGMTVYGIGVVLTNRPIAITPKSLDAS